MTTESHTYTITIPKKLIDDFINLFDDKYGGNESFFLNPLHEFLVSNISDKVKPHYTTDEVIAIAGGFK